MAHSKYRVFEEERNTLYLSMDGDNRLTGDPKEIDKIMERKKNTDVRIFRMLTGAADSDEFSESDNDVVDDRPKVKLIVEEVLPDGAEDDKPPDPVAEFVDPLSQLDTEQMLRLKTALASEQAKQLLGDNVTAMLDVLSVDDTAFIRNSIMQDHCYTTLSPSEDPKGPSFVQANNAPEVSRRHLVPKHRQLKQLDRSKQVNTAQGNASPAMADSDDQQADNDDEEYVATPEDTDTDVGDGSDSDYKDGRSTGFGVRSRKRGGGRSRTSRAKSKRISISRSPRREREEPVKEVKPETPAVSVVASYNAAKRGRTRRGGYQRSTAGGSTVAHAAPQEPELPPDHVAAKLYSTNAIRLGRSGKTDEERRKDIVRVLQNLPFSQKGVRTAHADAKPKAIVAPMKAVTAAPEIKPKVEAEPKAPVEAPPKNVMGGKYPRRENRKLPSHLADSIGPEIFSIPDVRKKKPAAADEGNKLKTVRIVPKSVQKILQKTKVEANTSASSAVPVFQPENSTVNDLQSMLEEGLNDSTVTDDGEQKNVSIDTESEKDLSKKPSDETQTLDISQLDPSLLQELPVVSMDDILTSVAEAESKAALKEESGNLQVVGFNAAESNSQSDGNASSTSERRRSIPKRRRSDEISNLDDSDIDDVLSEGSWNSDDDPDKLWCICRQPHNNRFMICCDSCEEWFHGKCVGIPKSIGKQMERDNLDWSCPACRSQKAEKSGKPRPELKQTRLTAVVTKRNSSDGNPLRKCIMCKAAARENSIYCSDQCISKHSQKALSQLNETTKVSGKSTDEPAPPRRIIVLDPTNKEMLTGQSAPTVANLAKWLLKNPRFRVFNSKDAQLQSANDTKIVKNLVQLKPALADGKGKQLTLTVSPNSKRVKVAHGNHQALKVVSPGAVQKTQILKSSSESSAKEPAEQLKFERRIVDISAKAVPKRRREVPTTSSSKTETSKERNSERAVRDSVRRTLCDSLKSRVEDSEDLKVNDADITDLASQIEDKLYKHFENKVDAKYKSKFRSLVFNIKDQKNKTLFRKIVEKAISPKELIRLSPEEMASPELAQWREKENQHQLEIIKKSELELMTQGQTFILKSRKGEEVIEKVQNVAAEIDPNTSAKELVSALNSVTSTTSEIPAPDKEANSETTLMKLKKREKERRREREKRHRRSRSHSRSRSSKKSKTSRKRSRSRSRDRHHRSSDKKDLKSRSSRHSRDSSDKSKEKEGEKDAEKETIEPIKEEVAEITTTAGVEQIVKDPVIEETDFEPTSTVTIKTPDTQIEEAEPNPVWMGQIVMPEVAKFLGEAYPAAGDSESISGDFADKFTVIGRIGYSNVWEYLAKVKSLASREIFIIQILPNDSDQDNSGFSTLYSYLLKRSRIAVIKPGNDRVKDFYLYPHQEGSPVPVHLQPLTIPLRFYKGQLLLGIVVRTKRVPKSSASVLKYATTSTLPKVPLPPTSPETMTTSKISQLPLPEVSTGFKQRLDVKVKKKVRVQVQSAKNADDGDSPYSPASSDEDLRPIQIQKKPAPPETIITADTDEIQKKIEEMNRAIEEQTQQIQSLASNVQLLPQIAPDLVAAPASGLLALQSILTTPMETESIPEGDSSEVIPMEIDEPAPTPTEPISEGEPYSPSGSLSPAPEEPPLPAPLVLPQEVTNISIPSNLQEILASIKQTSQDSPDTVPSPKASPQRGDSPEPLPPGVDLLDREPMLPKLKSADDSDDGLPVKITPKKPIKIDIKINKTTKAMLAEAATDHFLSRTDRDERFLSAAGSSSTEIPEKPADSEPKPARVEHRSLSNRDDRRSRQHGRRSDPHRSQRYKDPEREKLEAEWDGSIRKFENESRRRHREIREKEIERLRRRSDSE